METAVISNYSDSILGSHILKMFLSIGSVLSVYSLDRSFVSKTNLETAKETIKSI